MKKQATIYISFMIALLLTACGHSDTFRIEGKLADGSTINLRMIYYSDGAVMAGITASKEGKFLYEGHVANPALIEIYDNDYRLFGRVVASPGEDIKVTLDPNNQYMIEADGNETNRQWSDFLRTNAEMLNSRNVKARNELIAKYVSDNPDSQVSELLMVTEFDASVAGGALMADSLINLINPDVRNKGFSTAYAQMIERVGNKAANEKVAPIPYRKHGNDTAIFNPSAKPYNLIIFSDDKSGRDSIKKELRRLIGQTPRSRYDILELSLDMDTVIWSRSTRQDSASWTQGWAAGAISAQSVDRLGLPEIPYYIVADSTGKQIWRGKSITDASAELKNNINR